MMVFMILCIQTCAPNMNDPKDLNLYGKVLWDPIFLEIILRVDDFASTFEIISSMNVTLPRSWFFIPSCPLLPTLLVFIGALCFSSSLFMKSYVSWLVMGSSPLQSIKLMPKFLGLILMPYLIRVRNTYNTLMNNASK